MQQLTYNIPVPGKMRTTGRDGILTSTDLIFDRIIEENQETINGNVSNDINSLSEDVTELMDTMSIMSNFITDSIKVNITTSPTVYFNLEQNDPDVTKTITATANIPCSKIVIYKGSTLNPTVLLDTDEHDEIQKPIKTSVTCQDSIRNTTVYSAEFTYKIGSEQQQPQTKTITVSFVDPIYYGSLSGETTLTDITTQLNKYNTPTTTPKNINYNIMLDATPRKLYFAIPTGITQISTVKQYIQETELYVTIEGRINNSLSGNGYNVWVSDEQYNVSANDAGNRIYVINK